MSLADSLIVRVNELEEENERLRQKVQKLNEILTPTIPPPFRLSPQEMAIWSVLERRGSAPSETLIAAAGFGETLWPTKQLHVMINRIRAKVVPHGWIIRSLWGWGYELISQVPSSEVASA